MEIENYAEGYKNRTYLEKIVDDEIVTLLNNGFSRIVEIGCGDGALAFATLRDFKSISRFHAFDISETRIKRISSICSQYLASGKLKVFTDFNKLKSDIKGSVDLVVSEQVIEHVEGEDDFLRNILSLCGEHTIVYISTVFINGPRYYYYKNHLGQRVLDPTHVREYSNNNLIEKIREIGFDVIAERKEKVFYPLSSFINKVTKKLGFELFSSSCIWVRLPFYYHWRLTLKRRSVC